MAAPKGNQNAMKARMMSKHLRERIEERKLWPQLMDALLEKALDGDVSAIKECFDRVDGKAPQEFIGDFVMRKSAGDLSDDELATIAAGSS